MTYLLDANLLIALSDVNHIHHETAHRWFEKIGQQSWATCPLTENAFVRVLGKATYPKAPGTTESALSLLHYFCSQPGHRFWPDDISLRHDKMWTGLKIVSASHIPDCYLLALAVHHGGNLATFDRRIPSSVILRGTESLTLVS